MHSIGSGGVVYNANLKTTQTTLAQQRIKSNIPNKRRAANDRHLFLDKDSDSPIENFSRPRHLVRERSVL